MNKTAAHMMIQAVQVSLGAARNDPNPKVAFCECLIGAVNEICKNGYITIEEKAQIINARDRIFDAAVAQINDPSPNLALKALRTSVQMFGPQFIIDPPLMKQIVNELGHCPIWAVISTFGADTLYSGLTYPEAMHRAQVEAQEVGRESVVVLQIDHFQGPPLYPIGSTS